MAGRWAAPAELYTKFGELTQYAPQESQGVEMGRLSNFAVNNIGNLTAAATDAANGIKRSPVWRMIVVDEWPNAKNTDDTLPGNRTDITLPADNPGENGKFRQPQAYKDVADKLKAWAANPTGLPPFRPTDPDFDPMFDARVTHDAAGFMYIVGQDMTPNRQSKQINFKNQFLVPYPYIQREFYFTTDNSPPTAPPQVRDFAANKFRLRIPDRSMRLRIGSNLRPRYETVQTQSFIPLEFEQAAGAGIAPVLPGRYCVIGSAGTKYGNDQHYVTTIGRRDIPGDANTLDAMHEPKETRRIELRPNFDPNVQQLLVTRNGGDPKDEVQMGNTFDPYAKELGRDNELISERGVVKNIYDSNATDAKIDDEPDNRYYPPCVTIPVAGMNISEPPWGWGPREYEAAEEEQLRLGTSGPNVFKFNPDMAKREGRYAGGPFGRNQARLWCHSTPAPELNRTGTTANYRMIHLQRLANPTLPWNPYPLLADGTPNTEHRPNLPINPYRTIDSSSVNLTAFNGVSGAEGDIEPSSDQEKAGQMRPWIYGQGESDELEAYLRNMRAGKQAWYFRSLERGSWSRLNLAGSNATPPRRRPSSHSARYGRRSQRRCC